MHCHYCAQGLVIPEDETFSTTDLLRNPRFSDDKHIYEAEGRNVQHITLRHNDK